jgi:hypothetical protein
MTTTLPPELAYELGNMKRELNSVREECIAVRRSVIDASKLVLSVKKDITNELRADIKLELLEEYDFAEIKNEMLRMISDLKKASAGYWKT